MSDAARPDATQGPFARRLMLLITVVGILAFVATLVLGAYAPDLRTGRNGGGHALSNAAIGYSGLVRLAEATGRNPVIYRRAKQFSDSENLAVVTPPSGFANLGDIIAARGARATLIVLPKWRAQRQDSPPGWVAVEGLMGPEELTSVLAPTYKIGVTRRRSQGATLRALSPLATPGLAFREPPIMQTITGPKVLPLLVDSKGGVVLGRVGTANLYLLSDPDLLNNHGLATKAQAAAALHLLDELNTTGANGIVFDVTTNGLGHSRSPLRLAFDPPFLAVTLVIAAALLLAGWQALVRFGSPALPTRAIAFGKDALVENSAALVAKARREVSIGARYAALGRARAAARFHLAPGADPAATDGALDRLRPDHPFSALARAVEAAHSRADLTAAARAMHRWIQETGK